MKLDHLTPEQKKARRKRQVAAVNERYRLKHPDRVIAYKRQRQKTPEHQQWRREYEARPEVQAREKARKAVRTDKRRATDAKWQRERRAKFPMRRISHRMASLVNFHLKNGKRGKSWRAMVPYTPEQLIRHLERQFLPGMTWDNIGDWHIDHILPVSSFSFETEDDPEFQACWGLANLRPLWRQENQAKSDKIMVLM